MKVLDQSVTEEDYSVDPVGFIEKIGRVCYKSESKITDDSAEGFVQRIIKRGHESVLEHYRVAYVIDYHLHEAFLKQKYFTISDGMVSGNVRAWRDLYKNIGEGSSLFQGILSSFKYNFPVFTFDWNQIPSRTSVKYVPISRVYLEQSHKSRTFRIITDRGVSHELVRHRVASFSQESTRYVSYSTGIEYVNPVHITYGSYAWTLWVDACTKAEQSYTLMIQDGCSPQDARTVLNNSTKTELIMTATEEEWRDILRLRDAEGAHPQCRDIAQKIGCLL